MTRFLQINGPTERSKVLSVRTGDTIYARHERVTNRGSRKPLSTYTRIRLSIVLDVRDYVPVAV